MLLEAVEHLLWRRKPKYTVTQALLIDLAAILVWRGTWGLMDLYLFPGRLELSFLFSIIVGLIIMVMMRFRN